MIVAGNQYRSEYVCTTKESSMFPPLAPIKLTKKSLKQAAGLGATLWALWLSYRLSTPHYTTWPTFSTPVLGSQHKKSDTSCSKKVMRRS